MPTTYAIPDGRKYMAPVLYTGTGTNGLSITGVGFQTDFNWTKSRSSGSYSHQLSDSNRGFTKYLYSNSTNAEGTDATNHIQSVNSDGYVINSGASFNASGVTYVAWNWLCNAGTTSSNTSGTITSTVEANTTAGFSIVTYTTPASGAFTVGHGLGVAPRFIISRIRTIANNWYCYHVSLGNASEVVLNTTAASSATTDWNSTSPTSTVFSMGSGWAGSYSMVSYCFAAVAGYSAFGSYTGNASTDGPFVYLGFRPRWLMVKRFDSTGNWYIVDSARDLVNVTGNYLSPNLSNAEATTTVVDFLSNGFKIRSANVELNGTSMLYAAFAENPFKYANAR